MPGMKVLYKSSFSYSSIAVMPRRKCTTALSISRWLMWRIMSSGGTLRASMNFRASCSMNRSASSRLRQFAGHKHIDQPESCIMALSSSRWPMCRIMSSRSTASASMSFRGSWSCSSHISCADHKRVVADHKSVDTAWTSLYYCHCGLLAAPCFLILHCAPPGLRQWLACIQCRLWCW